MQPETIRFPRVQHRFVDMSFFWTCPGNHCAANAEEGIGKGIGHKSYHEEDLGVHCKTIDFSIEF